MPDESVWNETLVEQSVIYHIEVDGRLLLVESVPARVNVETGERYFAADTVERLQRAVWEQCPPCAPSRRRSMSTFSCSERFGRPVTA